MPQALTGGEQRARQVFLVTLCYKSNGGVLRLSSLYFGVLVELSPRGLSGKNLLGFLGALGASEVAEEECHPVGKDCALT